MIERLLGWCGWYRWTVENHAHSTMLLTRLDWKGARHLWIREKP